MQNISVTAIVCAYNEQETLSRVFTDLLKISFLSQIILVDDGSTDRTKEVAAPFAGHVVLISNPRNLGKGASVASALPQATGDLVLLLDADIVNYTTADLEKLIQPVILGTADFSMKTSDAGIFSPISGIRCYWKKDLLPLIARLESSGRYGLEVMLNKEFRSRKKAIVKLTDYTHKTKFQKFPLSLALLEYFKEALSLARQFLKG